MNITKTITAAAGLLLTLSACNNSSSDKVENKKEDVIEAKKDLKQAEADYAAELEKFRLETQNEYNVNQHTIDSLSAQIEKEKKEIREEDRRRIDELDRKNKDLKRRLDEYKDGEGNERWQEFKREFRHDMDELGHALRDFGRRNTK